MVRRAAKQDANHGAVVTFFEEAGATVIDLSGASDGVPDLLVGWRGKWLLVEVKDGDKPPSKQALTFAQVSFHEKAAKAGLPCYVVNSLMQAAEVLRENS